MMRFDMHMSTASRSVSTAATVLSCERYSVTPRSAVEPIFCDGDDSSQNVGSTAEREAENLPPDDYLEKESIYGETL